MCMSNHFSILIFFRIVFYGVCQHVKKEMRPSITLAIITFHLGCTVSCGLRFEQNLRIIYTLEYIYIIFYWQYFINFCGNAMSVFTSRKTTGIEG